MEFGLWSRKRPEDYRVVLQDIGDPLLRMGWPPSPEGLIEGSIGPLRNSAISMYAYGNDCGRSISVGNI